MARLDHLAVAGGDLDRLVAWWVELTGATPEPGGSHDGWGTRNQLVGIDRTTYVELVAPDPAQPAPDRPRPFGIDDLGPGDVRLATFALAVDDLDEACARVREAGLDAGEPRRMHRELTDGTTLAWRLAFPAPDDLGGVQPFLIEWGAGAPHPAGSLRSQVSLDHLRVRHPRGRALREMLEALDVTLDVASGEPSLIASLRTPNGAIELPRPSSVPQSRQPVAPADGPDGTG